MSPWPTICTSLSSQFRLCFSGKVKHFGKSLNIKRKTDRIDAKIITSYAGFDVVERESGTSIREKPGSPRKGTAGSEPLYFPALVASRHNAALQVIYQCINARKESKMVGVVILHRKLLLLLYLLWKSDTVFQDRSLASILFTEV